MVPPKYDRDFYGVTPPRELESPTKRNNALNKDSLSDVCEKYCLSRTATLTDIYTTDCYFA